MLTTSRRAHFSQYPRRQSPGGSDQTNQVTGSCWFQYYELIHFIAPRDVAAEFARVFEIMAGDMRTRIEVGKSDHWHVVEIMTSECSTLTDIPRMRWACCSSLACGSIVTMIYIVVFRTIRSAVCRTFLPWRHCSRVLVQLHSSTMGQRDSHLPNPSTSVGCCLSYSPQYVPSIVSLPYIGNYPHPGPQFHA